MTQQQALGLGISLYLSEPEGDNLARLASCPARGITAAFTSLHIPEDTNVAEQPRLLGALARGARDAGVRLFADISPLTLARLDPPGAGPVEQILALRESGVHGIRYDDGFGIDVAAATSHHMGVQLNASTVTQSEIDRLVALGAAMDNIEVLHNYYPRVDTGITAQGYGRSNARFRAVGLQVGAFAPGDAILRGPLHVGLPTLEGHRGVDPVFAAVELWRGPGPGLGADTVYVGDIDLDPHTWTRWKWLAAQTVPIRWEPARLGAAETAVSGMLSANTFSNRIDNSDRVIRVREFRPMIGEASALDAAGLALDAGSPSAGLPRPVGTVTVDNAAYGRYSGEVQITLVDLPADPRVCVLGRVIAADLGLLNLIPGGARLVLLEADASSG